MGFWSALLFVVSLEFIVLAVVKVVHFMISKKEPTDAQTIAFIGWAIVGLFGSAWVAYVLTSLFTR